MDLLAIGCMIENELGVQAIVCGDITYGQCVKAAEKASEILGEDIKPPVLCRLNDLYERISKLQALTDTEKIRLLLNRYLGDKDAKLGLFIREHFPSETISEYWRNRFHGMRRAGRAQVLSARFMLTKASYCKITVLVI